MSEFAIIILILAGAVIILTRDARVLLGALALHTVILACLAAPSAGWPMSLALLIGNFTAIGIVIMGLLASENAATTTITNIENSTREKQRRKLTIWQPRQAGFLQGLSTILAIVIAYGFGNKPIPGTSEASSGLPGVVAYWALAAGLVILLLNRDTLKIGSGIVILVNAGQMVYLMSARYLQSLVMIASVAVLLASAITVSRLLVMQAELPEVAEEEVHDAPIDPDQQESNMANVSEAH